MGRHGYSDDCGDDDLAMGRYRGQVASAIRGARGQAFLKDLVLALEAMPEKRLIQEELVDKGQVCALGAVGKFKGIDLENIDPSDHGTLAEKFGIAEQLTREIEWENDENGGPTPEDRWKWMHTWAKGQIRD